MWASAASTTSRGVLVRSAAQSRKLDRNPCGTAAMPSSLISWLSVASESGFPCWLGNMGTMWGTMTPYGKHKTLIIKVL